MRRVPVLGGSFFQQRRVRGPYTKEIPQANLNRLLKSVDVEMIPLHLENIEDAIMGGDHRNLVSCCIECNTLKADMPAPDFLRILYRKGRLTAAGLDGRLLALKDLAAGKLRPALPM
jgi:hypothetical protein